MAEGQPCVATRAATRSSAPYDTAQERCYMAPSALRYDVGAFRHARQLARHGAQCVRQGFESRYNFFYRDRGLRHVVRHGQCALRHCRRGATIRCSMRHDTAPNARRARSLGAVRTQRARSQGPRCAHCAPNPVLTQFTIYSQRGASQALLVFDQQAFVEAVGIVAAAIAQASAAGSQGGQSNLQRFRAHHPAIFIGGGDPMVAGH